MILLDIPHSLEQAQGDSRQRIFSSEPLEHPFPSVEPKTTKAKANLGEVSIEELLLQRHVQIALDGIKEVYQGEWCLPRTAKEAPRMKRRHIEESECETEECSAVDKQRNSENEGLQMSSTSYQDSILHRNPESESIYTLSELAGQKIRLPRNSTALVGDVATTLPIFTSVAPQFNLIIMDPPWPNRSARRKGSYGISYSTTEIRDLLSLIPISDHLAEKGLVGVWITNKAAFRDMLLGEGGLFDEWGIELGEEWVWVKVTKKGETVSKLNSLWRKPYEILLVGRRREEGIQSTEVKRRVIFGVPDLHSRKPNLKSVFKKVMELERYEALEIFARNMTDGWWAWGNEALKFQMNEHWINNIQDSLPSGQIQTLDIRT
ncbi:hypothetical protein G7Y89_g3592 [Cudoniella acicularis]|uniref:MT-A70-domain-containing protein n=1 Tax=Cudoniella acicularis TaxID=354080 RepID=A0A8H4W520_9HELO|nr:hypothetical protein G7Y89_g3592 [Cudoniella acicularis]